jgi:polysaccharide biosynthesis/export protein
LPAVDVARRQVSLTRGDTLSKIFTVPLSPGFDVRAPDGSVRMGPDLVNWMPTGDEFALQRDDHISIRRMPGDEDVQGVRITGEVPFPGTYILLSRTERISNVVQRAGGLASDAYAEGVQVWRKGNLLGINVQAAIANPGSRANVALEPGDSIHVPRYDPTVLVQGAVGFATRVMYVPGRTLTDYIDHAGGFAEDANQDRVSVAYPNGERQARRSTLFITRDPEILPGSSIFVPTLAPDDRNGIDWDRLMTRTLTIMSTIATLVLTYNGLK